MSEERNTITVAKVNAAADADEQARRAELSRQVLEQFTQQGSTYHYRDLPDLVAFNDNGDSIGTELDNTEVAIAMTKLAESRGWEQFMTKGSEPFYSAVEKRTKEASAEIERLQQSAPEKTEPTPQTTAEQQQSEPANTVVPESTNDTPDDDQTLRRAALVRSVNDQYRVAGTKYYFKDQAGSTNQLAFKDNGAKLSTSLNTERVTKSLVDLVESKGWTDINVSGHKEFKRQVWRAATDRGIEVNGYTPDENDLATVSDKALNNSIEQVSTKQATKAPNKSRDMSGVLVEHGAAPYQNKPDNNKSYFVTIDTGERQRTVWGVDLATAVRESGAQAGDKVQLRQVSATPIEVKDKDGQPVQSVRNSWTVERGDKREVITAVAAAVVAQNVPNESDRQRIAEGVQARIDAHDGPLPQVQMYDNNATKSVNVEQARAKTKAPELIR